MMVAISTSNAAPTEVGALVDWFLTEVVRQGLSSVAEEMTLLTMRAARSPALREAGDLSSALTDADGGIVANGKDLPIHLGVMAFTVKELIAAVGRDEIKEGDAWIVNQAHVGGNHLPDVKIIRPIFWESRLVAFAISLAHWADVGGGAPGSYNASATDIWQEGLQIPPLRIMRNNQVVSEILAFIKANVRGDAEREGDIHAQLAGVMIGDQRVKDMAQRIGLGPLLTAVSQIHDASERQMREVIGSLPDGTYSGEDFIDIRTDQGPVRIAVDIEVKGKDIVLDFGRSSDAIPAPFNVTPFIVGSAVIYLLKAMSGGEMYHSDGAFRAIAIRTRLGSILNPGVGMPLVAGNHETSQRIVDAVVRAFSQSIPDRLCAGGCGTAGLLIFAGRHASGRWWTLYETHGGGEGAHAHRDGCAATRVHLSNMANTPAEFIEAEYPIRVLRSEVRPHSGGAGRHRGGDGLVREYETLADDVTLTTIFERGVNPPYGLAGGHPGSAFRVTLLRGDVRTPLPGCQNRRLKRGDIVLCETAGGGGYGLPE